MFKLAMTSVAAFLVGKYGRPDGVKIDVDDACYFGSATPWLETVLGPVHMRMTTRDLHSGDVHQAEWLIHLDDGRWEAIPGKDMYLTRHALANGSDK